MPPVAHRLLLSLPLLRARRECTVHVLAKQTFAALLVTTPTNTHLHTHAAHTYPTTYRNGMRARTKWITRNAFASWKRNYGRWKPIAKRRSHLSNGNLRKACRLPQCWTVMMKRMRSEAEREACMLPLAMASNADRVQGKDGVSLFLSRSPISLLSLSLSLSLSRARALSHTHIRSLARSTRCSTPTRSPHYLLRG